MLVYCLLLLARLAINFLLCSLMTDPNWIPTHLQAQHKEIQKRKEKRLNEKVELLEDVSFFTVGCLDKCLHSPEHIALNRKIEM